MFWQDRPVLVTTSFIGSHIVDASVGWQPKMKFADGSRHTLEWYFANKDRDEVSRILARRLTER